MTTLGDIINTHIVTDTEDVKILYGGCSGPYFSDKICKLTYWDNIRPNFVLKIDAFTRKPFIFLRLYGNIIIKAPINIIICGEIIMRVLLRIEV